MEKKVKIGDYIILDINYNSHLKGYAELALKEQVPLLVYSGDNYNIYCKTDNLAFNLFSANPFELSRTTKFKIISKKKANEITRIKNRKFYIDQKVKERFLKVKHIKISDRKDYNLENKTFLKTDYNFSKLYSIETTENNINNFDTSVIKWLNQCCSYTKTTSNIVIYIPKTWLNYFGYNLTDLKTYINFLKKCDIGFNAKVLDVVNLYKEFNKIPNLSDSRIIRNSNNFYLNKKETAYKIFLNSDKTFRNITYLYFIFIRYLYNNQYWNIPSIAMKLKNKMPNVSNWDCLLLAHNTCNYNGYYSLCSTTSSSILMPHMNKQENILNKIKNGSSVNDSFTLTLYNNLNIRHLIQTENYKRLKEILNNFQNKIK